MNDTPHADLETNPANPRRRQWLHGAAAGLAGLALGPLAAVPARAEANGTRLRIGFQKYGNFVVLKARGTLEKRLANQGVTVQWLEFPAGPQLLEGLNAGAIDVGTVGETPPIFAQAAGVDFVYIGNEPPAPQGEAIVVLPDSPIRTVAQLRGKKVAFNKGSNVHYLLVKALEHAGLAYADIQPIYLTPADARAAFVQRSVDAWVIWDPYLAAAERQLGARVVANGDALVRNTQYYLAARKYAAAHPQVLRALLDEVDAVDRWARDHVPEVAAQLSPLVGLDAPTLEVALKRAGYGVQPITDATVAYQQNIADAFSTLKLIPGKLSVASAR
ncbi:MULTISPECIES: sulfonate ABC transporter substrate-binding protein [Burkholderia]|jgi:sulfonate transport system substrate-binding protein|uniref:Putative aliphatic sulfonates-binding protein n=5 Tax=Burkholderia cenocepacia TaxID=95486 RepID=A0ABD4U982_9BURK|nr:MULTISPECIES: sulfonate ABC transporter substrate-binding protein [Burkholderia]AIO46417.1 ABC transporter, substrate-binding, aliphatic sulfonates family protein [Burkholderia cepacia]AMU09775.1 ABC transporter substrate-binding protein [Burkholderia cenocepacia]KGC00050.1 ABC transporter, substrate-binding, aliphatic sulfonates family protein [Burkholderia cepacia]MBG0868830.1 sulfonate ABC transporter substrate-binding protein [Burkholderia sp. 9777_1386]MCG0577693.1 sulfonate ABC transp